MKNQNKIRSMKGVVPGIGSAGRSDKHWRERQPKQDSFGDVGRACTEFFKRQGMPWGAFQSQR